MTTDAERREATNQWTIQLREGQLREVRAQLAAVTARTEAAERERDAWKQEADDERQSMRSALQIMQERAEVAETGLAAEFVYAVELVNRYGADQWRRGVKGQPSVEFTHWKAANE